jgi:hypothetical protein
MQAALKKLFNFILHLLMKELKKKKKKKNIIKNTNLN